MADIGGGGGKTGRIIHGREIVYGTRSRYDAKSWICDRCLWENTATRFLLFDVPAWKCRMCLLPFTGNVDFSMADILVNEIALIQKIKNQGHKSDCIAYAIAHLMEIIQRLEAILKKEYLGILNSNINPKPLVKVYKKQCPMMCELVPPYSKVGLHKFLYMAQHVREQGISLMTGKTFKIKAMSTITIDDYECICEELADGNPLLVNFIPGEKFAGLEYCMVYKPIGAARVVRENDRNYIGHMAVLVGAISDGCEKGFWVLNSHSELFCPKFNVSTIPRSPWWKVPTDFIKGFFRKESGASRGGIFILSKDNIFWNAIKFYRSDDGPAPVHSAIRNENLYTKAAPDSGERDKAAVSDFLNYTVVGSHYCRRFDDDEKEEKALSMLSNLPFYGFPKMPPPTTLSRRPKDKRTREAFESLPFCVVHGSPSL